MKQLIELRDKMRAKNYLENAKILDAAIERIGKLEKEVERFKKFTDFQAEVVSNADTEIEQKDNYISELKSLLVDVTYVIENSCGVSGYHLNGEIAEWDNLLDTDLFFKLKEKNNV